MGDGFTGQKTQPSTNCQSTEGTQKYTNNTKLQYTKKNSKSLSSNTVPNHWGGDSRSSHPTPVSDCSFWHTPIFCFSWGQGPINEGVHKGPPKPSYATACCQ